MAKLPSFKFYPGDWLKDPSLAFCSPATRGVWMDLLCSMHELDHCGVITGTRKQIAQLTRCPIEQLDNILTELSETKTADVTVSHENVTVVNRRMKKEYKEREFTRLRKVKERASRQCHGSVTAMSQEPDQILQTPDSQENDKIQEPIPEIPKRTYQSEIKQYPTTIKEIRDEAEKLCWKITDEQAENFLAHYESMNWTMHGRPILNWKALIRKWKVNQYNFPKAKTKKLSSEHEQATFELGGTERGTTV